MIKIIFFLSIIVLVVIAVFLPNDLIDTRSCKRNWVAVATILISALAIIDKNTEALILFLFLSLGVAVNWVYVVLGLVEKKKVQQ